MKVFLLTNRWEGEKTREHLLKTCCMLGSDKKLFRSIPVLQFEKPRRCFKFSSREIVEISLFTLINRFIYSDCVILGGYSSIWSWTLLVISKILRKKIVLWTGASQNTTLNHSILHKLSKSIFLKLCNNCLTYGLLAKEYLKSYGLKDEKIFVGPNLSYISSRENINELIRSKYAKNKNEVVVGFIGRICIDKGFKQFTEVSNYFSNSDYKFVAYGALYDDSIDLTEDVYESNILYNGKIKNNDMASALVDIDILINPSLFDPFSRITSEGLYTGVYILSSIFDDSYADLISPSLGLVINPRETKQVINSLSELYLNRNWLALDKRLERVNRFWNKYPPRKYANSFVDSIYL